MSGSQSQIRIFAELAVFTALSVVLYNIRLYTLPNGGSITAGAMVPVLWFALRRGAIAGIESGIILGLIVMMIEPYLFFPLQILLDYPIAFGALGLAGLFRKEPIVGVGVGMIGRFISHFLSGIIFADIFIPVGENPYIYSTIYNGSYLLPEFIISAIIIFVLSKRNIINIYT
ncbi:energy-coupled thiamine transporter ThiT [Candidatus Bathyarchaeota archaeon]|nr:energy-coupled thiamine transporter ThiT [Candidatus Bathyarchaeota archaeon]